MELNEYIEKGGQKLRLGYTTGSCAAAAAKAAATMLLTGRKVPQVRLKTPGGLTLIPDIEDIRFLNEKMEDICVGSPETGSETGHRVLPAAVSCAVRKDSGDDPDITNHALIYATVASSEIPGIRIDGGEGVGRVTKPGLDQPVGNAAINSTPRRMIEEAVREAVQCAADDMSFGHTELAQQAVSLQRYEKKVTASQTETSQRYEKTGAFPQVESLQSFAKTESAQHAGTSQQHEKKAVARQAETSQKCENTDCSMRVEALRKTRFRRHIPTGFDVTISVPEGRALAAKTFNPKLGIEGGISILGTSGIVEPMSDQALLDTIRVEIRVRKEEGLTILPAAPGNYGRKFFLEKYGFSLDTAVTSSNFIYETVRMAAEAGFRQMLFVGHIGKLVKVAGGIRNTHSQYGDHRMEILTEIAEGLFYKSNTKKETDMPFGTDGRGKSFDKKDLEDLRGALAECVMTDEAIRILREYGLDAAVLSEMTHRIQAVMQEWAQGKMQVEAVVFSNVHGELGRTEGALEYMRILQEQVSGGGRSH